MGHVLGGWNYVWASYLLAWGGLTAYAVALYRRRSASASAPDDGGRRP
jgi:hypothetical protein